jgi:hypothetical protein
MKRSPRLALASALLLSSMSLVACSDDSDDDTTDPGDPGDPGEPGDPGDPTTPKAEDYDDIAQSVGALVVVNAGGGEVGSIRDSLSLALGVRPLGFDADASGTINGNRFGLDYSYALTCNDAAGNALTACDDRTDAATVDVSWGGSLDLPTYDAVVDRQGSWSVTDVQGPIATFNGDSTFDFDATFQSFFRPVTRTYHLAYAADYTDVKIDTESEAIVGGVIGYEIDAQRLVTGNNGTVEASFDVTAEVTFDANGNIVLELDGTAVYDVNGTTGDVTRR